MRLRANRGFTMVELMVTVAIVAVLAAIAFPSFEASMRSNRVATAGNELLASISLARSEAIRSPGGAALCASSDGSSCNGTSWGQGWIVWIDMDGDGLPTGANDRVVRYVQALPKVEFTATSPGGAIAAHFVRFDRGGRLVTTATGAASTCANSPVCVTIASEVCPTGNELRRQLMLNRTGQTRMEKTTCT